MINFNNLNRLFRFSQLVKTKFIIQQKKKINHDCYIYTFGWNGPKFSLKIGQHLQIVQQIITYDHPEGQQIIRKYTPITQCSEGHVINDKNNFIQNYVDILFKIYKPNIHPNFPHGGKLTPYIQKLKEGDSINIQGPLGKFGYQQGGIVILNGVKMKKDKIFFIVGGTGVTPAYQTIKQIFKMPQQKKNMKIVMLFANKTKQDIILRKQLESLVPDIKLYHTIEIHENDPQFLKGRVTKQMLEQICPLNQQNTLYCHCGPAPMNNMIRKIFKENYPKSTLFKY